MGQTDRSEQVEKILKSTVTGLRSRAGTEESEHQVLAVVTETETCYFELDYGAADGAGEAAVLAALKKTRKILGAACMWKGGSLDLPSRSLRQGLLDLDPENGEAWILLQGEDRILAKRLADTL